MNLGYVNLFRKFKQWEWYRDPVVKNVFIELMLDVNYQDRKWQGMEIKKGQTVTSLPKIADAVNLSIQQVRTALKKLESTGEITTVSTGKGRVITLCNFDDYNSDKTKSNRQNETRSNRVATGFPTGNQQTINRQYATGEELPESPLEWGSQPVDCLLATDDQQAKTGEKTGELTGILTPNNKVLIKNKEEEEVPSASSSPPSRMIMFWDRHRSGTSISENSLAVISETLIKPPAPKKKNHEQPQAKAKQYEPPQPVVVADPEHEPMIESNSYPDEIPVQDDLLDWEKAAQSGDAIGALGFRIAMKPDEIRAAVKFKNISAEIFEAWLVSRAANDFRTPKGNKPIGAGNWHFDIDGFARSWMQNDKNGKPWSKNGSHHMPATPVSTTKDQVENWRELATTLGFDFSKCKRFRDLDTPKKRAILNHPDAQRIV